MSIDLRIACLQSIIERLIELVDESHAKMILYTHDRIIAHDCLS